ncbi:MAG: condensation domain-containing protein, partial [Bacteroidota bacterium]
MQRIWEKVLQREVSNVTETFFELGGNSLKAAELGMHIQKEFQVELSLDVLYEHQTIRKLSVKLQDLSKLAYQPIPLSPKREWYPLSSAQLQIYYQWALNKSSLSYNMPIAVQINGDVSYRKIKSAWKKLVNRHEALRMYFRMKEAPQYAIQEKVEVDLEILECGLLEVEKFLSTLLQAFDLNQASLFRIKLIKLKHEKHILFLDLHHIISDGISAQKLLQEFWMLYAGKVLDTKALDYKDYVAWNKKRFVDDFLRLQQNYWKSQLAGDLPILRLPLDFDRPAFFSSSGSKLNFYLNENKRLQLKNFAEAHHCSLHILLFAFYSLLLSKYAAQDELMIGIPVAKRPHPDLQDMQGLFVNNLPIKVKVDMNNNFLEFLLAMKHKVDGGLRNQEFPYEQMIGMSTTQRDVSRNPLFDTMFIFQNMGFPKPYDDQLGSCKLFFDPGIAKYDLSMEVFDEGDGIEYNLEYADSLFKKEKIMRMAGHFELLIDKILLHPENPLSALSLLSPETFEDHIYRFNDTQLDTSG